MNLLKILQEAENDLPQERTPSEIAPEDTTEDESSSFQGLIRTVKGAHLVYKREQNDGSFEELWIYNISPADRGVTKAQDIRQAILAGTDIPVGQMETPDGTQSAESWARGNAELMKIVGLIN